MNLRPRLRRLYNAVRGSSVLERRIPETYQRILGRQPDADEVLYWRCYLEGGYTLAVFENRLRASYEHEVNRANDNRRLVDLGRFKMYVDTTDPDVGMGILNTRQYEPHVTANLLAVLKPGSVFLDIGANIGYFSMLGASVAGASGKVICFEPNVSNLRLLHASIVANGFDNVQVYPLAASDSKRILRMQAFGSNGFLGPAPADPANFQFVQSIMLDELLDSEPRIDVVKIDIEGFESLALKGMRRLIARHRPILLTELNPWHLRHRGGISPAAFLDEVISLGFQLSVIGPSSILDPAPDANAIMKLIRHDKDHLDLLAKPKDSP